TATILQAWAQQGLGETDAALATIDGLRGPDWYALFRNFHHSLIAEIAGRPDEALAAMKAAYEGDGTGLRMAEGYARILSRTGDNEKALEVLREFEGRARNHPVVEALAAEIEAGKTLEPLVETPQQGAAELLYALGLAVNTDGG